MVSMDPALRLTAVLQLPLLARTGERVGRVHDLVARLSETGYPPILGLIARVGSRELFVPLEETAGIDSAAVRLAVDRLDVRSFERRRSEILLQRDLLGRHVIQLDEARLERVGDITLEDRGGELQVTGITVASSGILARLHLPFGRHRQRVVRDWSSIEPFVGHVPTIGRRLPFTRLARLHPAELADIVEAASHREGEEIMTAVGEDPEVEADVFEELNAQYQVEFLQTRSDDEAAAVLARMTPDDAADLLLELEEEHRRRLLGCLPLPQLRKVRMLLGYHPETAGGLMSPDFLALPSDTSVETALEEARRSELSALSVSTVFVTGEAGRLVGALSLADLLRHADAARVGDIVTHDPVFVEPYTDIPGLARRMADFNLGALPVVDEHRSVIGIVTVDDVLEVMLPADWRALTGSDVSIERGHRAQLQHHRRGS
ncbi:MAG TPA: magnesium transporter [Chloroflexota bacterium]